MDRNELLNPLLMWQSASLNDLLRIAVNTWQSTTLKENKKPDPGSG